jgi:hypothetical protein
MKSLFQTLLASSAIAIGAGVMASAPASAASLADPVLGGSADTLTYCADGTNTFECDADAATVLTGDAASPGGNIELASESETDPNFFASGEAATLSGTLNGKSIAVSSLTAADWATDMGGGITLAQKWFSEAIATTGSATLIGQTANLFGIFAQYGGLERFSDPNISYINQDDTTGEVKIGLAGHLNATPLIVESVNQLLAAAAANPTNMMLQMQAAAANVLLPEISSKVLQASEVVKVSYDGAPAQYLYSFVATASGLVEAGDGVSHTGNYEVSFEGQLPPGESVPEPTALLGLAAVGGMIIKRRQAKNA